MKNQGLSRGEENWLRDIVGDADPEDRLRIQKVPTGYIVDLDPSMAGLKPMPCSDFLRAIEATVDLLIALNR